MNKKIKILFTIPNFDTAGSGKSVYDMVNGLDRDYFEPEIACFHDRGALFKEIEKLNVKIHLVQFTTPYRPLLSFPLRVHKIYKFFKSNRFDIIHSWHWSSDFSEPLAARWAKIPFIYSKKAMGWGNKAWTWRSKLSTKIVVVNEDMLDQFFTKMKSKVVQIPLCVDIDRFKPKPKSYQSPEGIAIDKDDFVIVSVANLVAVKGIELLLDAVLKLNDKRLKVFIVGDYENDYGLPLKAKYEQDRKIFFMGKHLDVRPYLALADVFVIPTKDEGRREGLPIAPMEAMASGRIVLGSNITGVREVLKRFPECQFEANSVDGIVEKLTFIKSMSQSDREKLANDMRAYVEAELSIQKFLEEHESLYKSIIKN